MRIGELFAGIGGLGIAAQWTFGGSVAWQADLVGEKVRRRHFPEAVQVVGDVREVNPGALEPVDVLCAGFACQDLSTAGPQTSKADIHAGDRTGTTYREMLRFVRALGPRFVVLENVPALLNHRRRIEADLRGYGLTWVLCSASDVGAPHRRRRVFVVGRRGGAHGGLIEAPIVGRWCSEEDIRAWSTICASEACGRRTSIARRDAPDILSEQVRPWGTPRVGGHGSGGEREDDHGRLEDQAVLHVAEPVAHYGRRLNPAWVEVLMGFPVGWTALEGEGLQVKSSPRWPRGRYPADWDRSKVWPGHAWEPPRTIPDGPPCPGRPARIRGLGNAVVPQQGAHAITIALRPAQVGLFGAA